MNYRNTFLDEVRNQLRSSFQGTLYNVPYILAHDRAMYLYQNGWDSVYEALKDELYNILQNFDNIITDALEQHSASAIPDALSMLRYELNVKFRQKLRSLPPHIMSEFQSSSEWYQILCRLEESLDMELQEFESITNALCFHIPRHVIHELTNVEKDFINN